MRSITERMVSISLSLLVAPNKGRTLIALLTLLSQHESVFLLGMGQPSWHLSLFLARTKRVFTGFELMKASGDLWRRANLWLNTQQRFLGQPLQVTHHLEAIMEREARAASPKVGFSLMDYLRTTTSLFHSLILILPIFFFYQAGVIYQLASTEHGALSINGADYFTHLLLHLCGGSLILYSLLVLAMLTAFGLGLRWRARNEALEVRVFPGLLLESTLYALSFASIIHFIQGGLTKLAVGRGLSTLAGPSSTWEIFFQSFGAGINEELIFRLLGLGGIVFLSSLVAAPRALSIAAAFVLSSLAFSAFHYIGPYADLLLFDSFMYRFLAGILLATLYWWRGIGVAVYTHAFYDLYFFFVLSPG